MPQPKITLHFLQASRSIRTAWLLEELSLPYTVKFSPRENGVAPAEFKKSAGGLGKFPTLEDDGQLFYESTNITEYLCDTYDKSHALLPPLGDAQRYKVLQWSHASEATYLLHGLAILYAKWFQAGGDVDATVAGLSKNVVKDLDYLESTLGSSGGKFLLGDRVTAADVMMHFSAAFILARELGTQGGEWPEVKRWIADCEATETYKRAVEKTGHEL